MDVVPIHFVARSRSWMVDSTINRAFDTQPVGVRPGRAATAHVTSPVSSVQLWQREEGEPTSIRSKPPKAFLHLPTKSGTVRRGMLIRTAYFIPRASSLPCPRSRRLALLSTICKLGCTFIVCHAKCSNCRRR